MNVHHFFDKRNGNEGVDSLEEKVVEEEGTTNICQLTQFIEPSVKLMLETRMQ